MIVHLLCRVYCSARGVLRARLLGSRVQVYLLCDETPTYADVQEMQKSAFNTHLSASP